MANNYGRPPGSAETAFGEILKTDFHGLRDEMIILVQGPDTTCGPDLYGNGAAANTLSSSCDQSLQAHGPRLCRHLLFASFRSRNAAGRDDAGALIISSARAGRSMPASRATIPSGPRKPPPFSSNSARPVSFHQPSYSMNQPLGRGGTVCSDTLDEEGIGSIVFSPLAQGMLTGKYLNGIPEDSRAAQDKSLNRQFPQRAQSGQYPVHSTTRSPSAAARP